MNETIIAAFITLFGSILTVYVGYRQWKNQQERNYLPVFQNERLNSYQKLWDLLPDLSSKIDTHERSTTDNASLMLQFSEGELFSTLEKVRLFLMKNELLIPDEDRWLVIHYLESAIAAKQIFSKMQNKVSIPSNIEMPILSQNRNIRIWQVRFLHMQTNIILFYQEHVLIKLVKKALAKPSHIWLLILPLIAPDISNDASQFIKEIDTLKKQRRKLVERFRLVTSGKT